MTGYLDFSGPAELRTRGTIVVLPGRGESQGSYRRFGRRLAADSYQVRVLAPLPVVSDVDGLLKQFDAELGDAVPDRAEQALVRPLVLVGADTGAAVLASLVAQSDPTAQWWPDGVVLAALPGYDAGPDGGWDDELDARTHCPVHRLVLGDDPAVQAGSFAEAAPVALLDAAYASAAPVPHLVLVGDDDPWADRGLLGHLATSLPSARLTVVRGAHHDVLNDLQHRSVAAEIVTFLEALRAGPPFEPLLRREAGAW